MRAGLTTIQQTLTPEAATVLNHSISEAARRGHSQTTPLHVAATLLGSPTGYLREACIRSHPNSSHPLQCRALELCFSIALDRLPSGHGGGEPNSAQLDPPISNALMAALKRAQAHQRRGCPEQQQQPLLAVKVELEQLIISILDDPSISRVMREASFSSPAVKAAIEQSLNSAGTLNSAAPPVSRNLYMNPRLQKQQPGQPKREEVRRVVDILLRWKKRNPILVGESEPEAVIREVLQMVEKREVSNDGRLRNVQVVSLEKEFSPDQSQIPGKLSELGNLVETRLSRGGSGGLIINLGDLKWLVEQPAGLSVLGPSSILQQQKVVSETARAAVMAVAKLLARFGSSLWLIGTATSKTYLRCQVYHPSMENDWDLQAVPIATRTPLPGLFPRLGGNGILNSSAGSLTPLKGVPMTGHSLPSLGPFENKDPARGASCCPVCMQNYKRDLSKIASNEFEKSSLDSKSEPRRRTLPQWMQNAKLSNGGIKTTDQTLTKDQELTQKHKTEELQKKWNETCRNLHPSFHMVVGSDRMATAGHSLANMYNPNLLGRQPFQSKLQLAPAILQTGHAPMRDAPDHPITPPKSPVRTDLVLGCPKITENSTEKTHKEHIKDLTSCIPSEWWQSEKHANALDSDSFKRIFKGLTEKVGWQLEAASAITTTIIQRKAGHGNHHGVGAKGYTWLLFVGPDKVGKKKMASALSELICGAHPITIRLGSQASDDDESDVRSRGKTVLDRIAEAVRRNPFSVVVLENIDRADMLVQASIKRAIEKGRLMDSHGREISLGSVIFIMTTEWVPENLKNSPNSHPTDEDELAAMVGRRWLLQISVVQKTSKRRAERLMNDDDNRPTKARNDAGAAAALPFDLNLAANMADDNATEGSRNSSGLTVDHEQEHGPVIRWPPSLPSSYPLDMLIGSVDNMIVFRPVNFGPLRSKVASKIAAKFAAAVGDGWAIQVDSMVVDRIVGGAWFGQTGFDEWADRVLAPGFQRLKTGSLLENCTTVRLLSVDSKGGGDWLPGEISVVVDRGA